jgi:hypothetical protein
MSRKYIRQQILQDFVYPNNEVSQYDVDDIVHDLNDNCVDGTVNSFTATSFSSTGLTISYDMTWNLNGAEPWIQNQNRLGIWSIHMLAFGQDYYKPWRIVDNLSITGITSTTSNNSGTFTVTPSQMGLTGFTSGTYYFEVRFIGHRCVYPVCVNLDLVLPTPTPTPTPSSTSVTPTPTPTPTSVTPTPTPTPSSTICIVPTLYLTSTSSDDACNQINGQLLTNISHTDSVVCPYCEWTTLNSTEIPSLADGTYYVSDGTNVRSWTKTATPSVLYNPSACSSCPTPTPTPTTTSVTPTPTPTPSSTPGCLCYLIFNETAGSLNYDYNDCVSGNTSNSLLGGVSIEVCSANYPNGIGLTIVPCTSETNCTTSEDCTDCT